MLWTIIMPQEKIRDLHKFIKDRKNLLCSLTLLTSYVAISQNSHLECFHNSAIRQNLVLLQKILSLQLPYGQEHPITTLS